MTPDDDLICAINRLALTAVGVVVATVLGLVAVAGGAAVWLGGWA